MFSNSASAACIHVSEESRKVIRKECFFSRVFPRFFFQSQRPGIGFTEAVAAELALRFPRLGQGGSIESISGTKTKGPKASFMVSRGSPVPKKSSCR